MSCVERVVDVVEEAEETEEVRGVNASSCILSKETIDWRLLEGCGEEGC